MLRWLSLVVVVALVVVSRGAFGDDLEDNLPGDPEARLMILIAQCDQGDAAVCRAAAKEMDARRVGKRAGKTASELRARATTLLEAQCAQNHGPSCFELARAKTGKARDAQVAHACELHSGDACLYLAVRAKLPGAAGSLLEQACTYHNAHACSLVATKLEKADPQRALVLHDEACHGDEDASCVKLAQTYASRNDAGSARSAYEDACELRLRRKGTGADLAPCDEAAQLARRTGVPSDAQRARELLHYACEGQLGAACVHEGEMQARGDGGERDWGAGLLLVQRGCNLARDGACASLAALKKSPPDATCTSVDQCTRFCDETLGAACRRVVELAPEGPGNNVLLEQACTYGDATGCRMRGDASSEFAEARPWYDRGCKAKDAASCGYMRFARAPTSPADAAAMKKACAADRAACTLYAVAIARRDRKTATRLLADTCAANIGAACRMLAASLDRRGSPGAWSVVGDKYIPGGYGVCDCDGSSPPPTKAEQQRAAEEERRQHEAERLYGEACAAGDAPACAIVGREPPATKVTLPTWL